MKATRTLVLALWSLALLGLVIGFNGCKGSDSPATPSVQQANLSGIVIDEAGKPLEGVSVESGGQTTMSDALGRFALSQATAVDGRYVLRASKAGFFMTVHGITPANTAASARVMLTSKGTAKTFTAGAASAIDGGDGMKVNLPAGLTRGGSSFSGGARAYVKYVSPTDPNLPGLMPGSDFEAINASGASTMLKTYGAVQVELEDNAGQELQLASGQTAELRFPANGSTLPTIPLWSMNEATGLWVEEGTATLQGSEYVGTVSHFSSWNIDIPVGRAAVKGRLMDCSGQPATGVTIKTGQRIVITDQDGDFLITVPANESATVSTEFPGGGNVSATVSGLAEGSVTDITNQLACVPAVYGRMLTCNGQPASGYAYMLDNSGRILSSIIVGANGSFRLTGPASTPVKVMLGSESGGGNAYGDTSITTPASGAASVNLGDIRTCASSPSDTGTSPITGNGLLSFRIQGDGYANRAFTIGNMPGSVVMATYYADFDNSAIAGSQADNGVATGIALNFEGGQPGTFVADGSGITSIVISVNGPSGSVSYVSETDHEGTITITQFDAVGGRIKGTFSGTLRKVTQQNPLDPTTITISNGTFDVQRGNDQ